MMIMMEFASLAACSQAVYEVEVACSMSRDSGKNEEPLFRKRNEESTVTASGVATHPAKHRKWGQYTYVRSPRISDKHM